MNEADPTTGMQDLQQMRSNNYSKDASKVREEFKDYFDEEKSIDWQLEVIDEEHLTH